MAAAFEHIRVQAPGDGGDIAPQFVVEKIADAAESEKKGRRGGEIVEEFKG